LKISRVTAEHAKYPDAKDQMNAFPFFKKTYSRRDAEGAEEK